MKFGIQKFVLASIVTVALPTVALATVGTVSLEYTPLTSNVASPGSSVTLSLSLVVTGFSGADAVGGFDFFLTSQNSSSGAFFIQSRTIDTNGAFPDPQTNDTVVATRPGANLDPTNDNDLGQSVAVFPTGAVQDGTYHLANYVIGVDAGVAPATYNFLTSVNLWTDQNGGDHALTSPGSFSLTIIPEPAVWSLLVFGGLAMIGLQSRRNRRSH